MEAPTRQRHFWVHCVQEFVIPFLIALPVLWALLPGGLPNTADGTVHFIRAVEMLHAWRDGVLLPRWSENLGYGYGIPLFVYAPPLPYLVAVALAYLSAPLLRLLMQAGLFTPASSGQTGVNHGPSPEQMGVYPNPSLEQTGINLELAFKGMMVLAILVAVFGAYRLARNIMALWSVPNHTSSVANRDAKRSGTASIWAGAAGAAAFVYAPIMLRELFIQGNIAQYWAWTFSPWAVWAILRLYQTHRFPYVFVLALALLGTLLSHNAAALLLMATIGGLGLLLFVTTRDLRGFGLTVTGSLAGLWLGFWFWGPALLEGKYVQLHHIVASDFRPRFIPLSELLALSPPLDSGAINPYFPLTLGAIQVWLGVIGMLALSALLLYVAVAPGDAQKKGQSFGKLEASRKIQDGLPASPLLGAGIFFSLLALFCGFMATAWSEPVWSALPFVDLFEWPFRWHGFTALGLSWLCAFAVFALIQTLLGRLSAYSAGKKIWATAIGGGALMLLLGSALVNLYPQKLLLGTRLASPYEVVRYEVKSSAVGTTSLGEFNPIWVDGVVQPSPLVDAYLSRQPVDRLPTSLAHPADSFLDSGASGLQVESSVHRQSFRLQLPEPQQLTLHILYFPGWRATIDGQPVPLRPQAQSGLMVVDLPAGEYTLTLTLGATPLRRVAGLLSVVAWLAVAVYAAAFAIRRVGFTSQPARAIKEGRPGSLELPGRSSRQVPMSTLWLPAATIGLIIVLLVVVRATQDHRFVRHSPPDHTPPTDVRLRVDFEDKLRLLGVDSPAPTVRQGAPITVVAYWRALAALEDDYAVFLHLDIPHTGETIATDDQLHPSDIPTSGWATGQYVRNPLTLVTPVDALPIQYSLRIGVYDHDGHLLDLADGTGDSIEVGRIWVTPRVEPRAPDGPRVRFGETIELLDVDVSEEALTLYWRTQGPIVYPYSIFVHLLDSDGDLLGQLDGAPFSNRYPLPAWQPGQIIVDRRPIAAATSEQGAIDRFAIGLYDPQSGDRLSAIRLADRENANLRDNAILIELR